MGTAELALSPGRARSEPAERRGAVPHPPAVSGWWRVVRGGAVAAVATGFAVAGHVYAGGEPPQAWVLAATALTVGATSVVLSPYRWTWAGLLVLLLAVQLMLHALFDATAAATAGHPAEHIHRLPADEPGDGSMTLAHVLAAAATSWALARGEKWLWLLLGLLALRATRLLHSLVLVKGALSRPAPHGTDWLPRQPVGLGAWSLRGPPGLSK